MPTELGLYAGLEKALQQIVRKIGNDIFSFHPDLQRLVITIDREEPNTLHVHYRTRFADGVDVASKG